MDMGSHNLINKKHNKESKKESKKDRKKDSKKDKKKDKKKSKSHKEDKKKRRSQSLTGSNSIRKTGCLDDEGSGCISFGGCGKPGDGKQKCTIF